MLHISPKISVPQFDKLINKYNIKAEKVAEAAKKAVNETTEWALGEMRARVFPHINTGAAFDALERTPAKENANVVKGSVGALNIREGSGEEGKGFHIVYQEHGGKDGKGADPWFRPVMSRKAKMRSIQEKVFKREGYIE